MSDSPHSDPEGALGETPEDLSPRLLAVLRGLRGVNQLIVRERDPLRLIPQACDVLVAARGFVFAAVVLTRGGLVRASAYASVSGEPPAVWDLLADGTVPPCFRAALEMPGAATLSAGDRSARGATATASRRRRAT